MYMHISDHFKSFTQFHNKVLVSLRMHYCYKDSHTYIYIFYVIFEMFPHRKGLQNFAQIYNYFHLKTIEKYDLKIKKKIQLVLLL